jgi:hypothetical protein
MGVNALGSKDLEAAFGKPEAGQKLGFGPGRTVIVASFEPQNEARTVCYHFATQLGGTTWY